MNLTQYKLLTMNDEAGYNPVLAQLKLFKNKLSQKGKLITILTECIKAQQAALFSIVAQFQEHESKIMRRLHRLEQINLRYIKDYLVIKNVDKTEDFVPINHMFAIDAKSYISKKIEAIKKIENSDKNVNNPHSESKQMVDSCLNLMKNYIANRKINYQKMISTLSDERKKKMKQSKGLQGYRQNKQQAKFIEEIKKKIANLDKKMSVIDNRNAVQLFNRRQQIEMDITRLDPSKGEITLEDSLAQQKLFKQIIQEIVTNNESQQIQQLFLEGSFNFIQDKIEILSEIYGVQYVNQSIKSIVSLSAQQKDNIFNRNDGKSNKSIAYASRFMNEGSSNIKSGQKTFPLSGQIQYEGATNKQLSSNRNLAQNQMFQQFDSSANIEQEESQQISMTSISKMNRNRQLKTNNKLNNKFEKTMTKTFFQQQEKSRDQLISLQKSEIVEHAKVIDKLINFIKKQFKERKMDDIDGDDPQQLIGYYFKVNEKKYVDIREEMQVLQKETAKTVNNLTFQNQELNIKVSQLKQQMEDLLKKYQKSSFQLHILISRTEDLVKISLETLINNFMKHITPQELILQLEHIIDLIKQNMQKKRNMTYKFTIRQETVQNNQQKVQRKDFISVDSNNYQALTEQLDQIRSNQIQDVAKSECQKQQIQGQIQQIQVQKQSKIQNSNEMPLNNQIYHEAQNKKQDKSRINELIKSQASYQLKIQSKKNSEIEKNLKNSEGFDERYLNSIREKIEIIKDIKLYNQSDQLYDINEMYSKYKQALDCLERAENINRQNQIKYQKFLNGLKKKHAWECPQKLQEKLFYMEKLIAEQNQLLQNQRAEYEQTILKQVNQSQVLAQSILKKFKLKRRQTKI